MKVMRSDAETEQIKALFYDSKTFRNVFKKDWTLKFFEDLKYRLYGKIPRNFLVNITGGIGTPTGIFKSTMGLQIALALDPNFNLKDRVAFSVNKLLDKVKLTSELYLSDREYLNFIKSYTGSYDTLEADKEIFNQHQERCTKLVLLKKLIYFLDEQTKTLRTGGLIRLQNLVDTCRQRQICFITCGVESYDLSFSTYDLVRVEESHDDYLPKKTVRYGVYDRARDIYYGFLKWNITPLSDIKWGIFWKQYSIMKTSFQRIAISQQTSSMDFNEYAREIMDSPEWESTIKVSKKGRANVQIALVKLLIMKKYPDLTNDERNFILSEIKIILQDGKEE